MLGVATAPGLTSCGSEPPAPTVSEELARLDADNVMFGMFQEITKEGVLGARVEADTAYYWQNPDTVALFGMRLIVYDEMGRPKANVTALRGSLDLATERMTAFGDVVLVVRDNDQRLETAELYYDPPRNRIWSDSATVMTEGSTVTRGTGFESDVEFRNVTIRNAQVSGGRIRF